MKGKLPYTIVRLLLGLGFIFFGVSKFLPWPAPPITPGADAFLLAMENAGYFIPFVGLAETLVGILLVFNLWVPFAMMVLSPIMLNVLLFNLFLAPGPGMIMLVVLMAMQGYIMYKTWHVYKPLFNSQIK